MAWVYSKKDNILSDFAAKKEFTVYTSVYKIILTVKLNKGPGKVLKYTIFSSESELLDKIKFESGAEVPEEHWNEFVKYALSPIRPYEFFDVSNIRLINSKIPENIKVKLAKITDKKEFEKKFSAMEKLYND